MRIVLANRTGPPEPTHPQSPREGTRLDPDVHIGIRDPMEYLVLSQEGTVSTTTDYYHAIGFSQLKDAINFRTLVRGINEDYGSYLVIRGQKIHPKYN